MVDARNQFETTHSAGPDALSKCHVAHAIHFLSFLIYFSHSLSMIYVKNM